MKEARDWCITHSSDDYHLRVFTYKRRSRITRIVTERIMAMLGHPCCGNGIGKIDAVAAFTNNLLVKAFSYEYSHEKVVLDLTVTKDEAFTADPSSVRLMNELGKQ